MKSLVFVVTSKTNGLFMTNLIPFFSRQADYTLRKGTTEVLSTNVKKIEYDVVGETVRKTTGTGEAMELA